MRHDELDETRAEVARRRLAQLAAAFEADLPPDANAVEPKAVEPKAVEPKAVEPSAAIPSASGARADPPHPARGRAPVGQRVTPAHLRVVGVVAVGALVVLGWVLLSGRPQTAPEAVAPLTLTSPTPTGAAASAELVIDVIGEVKRPGIVTVPRGSRVYEAIEAAGGLDGKKVDTSGVNLARVLDDGEQVVVGPAAADTGVAPAGSVAGGKVRLNQATPEQLDTLPGVGPVTAAAIVAWRDENGRFSTVDDLLDVKGIGEATLAELRDLVTP